MAKKSFYFLLLCSLSLLSCDKKEGFRFYVTSDFHRIVWDGGKDDIFLLKGLRDSEAAGRIFIDAGGSFSRDHLENRHTSGAETASAMEDFGHDAVVIDSETLKLSPKELETVAARLDGRALSSNLYWKNGKTPDTVRRHLVLNSGGTRVGIIAAILGDPEKPDKHSYVNAYKIENPVYEINRNMEKIKKISDIKILVLNSPFEDLKKLRKNLDALFSLMLVKPDVIIMSGTDTFSPFKHKNAWIMPSRIKSSGVFRTELRTSSAFRTKSLEISPLKPADLPRGTVPDAFAKKISQIREKASAYFDKVISTTPSDLEAEKDGYSPLGDVIADSVKNYIKSNGAIISRSSFKKDLKAGEIKVRDIYEILDPDDNLTYTKIRGSDVTKLVSKLYGRKISVSGLSIRYKAKEPSGILINGRPVNEGEIYRFLIPQSLINDDYSILSHSTEFAVLPRTTLDAAMWYLRSRKLQAPREERRITEE